jgi:hypothetical protein
LLRCMSLLLAHRDKSQSREFAVGIGWKADIGRQSVSTEPVAIDPVRS